MPTMTVGHNLQRQTRP